LVLLRAELDKNEEILSRDYMQKQCATPDGEKRYIEELKKVNDNYNLLKMSYLKELEVYLKKLEEEGYN
jgi:hypothetical protein